MVNYSDLATELDTVWDFVRFGMTAFQQNDVYFGHGTDNSLDDALAIVLESLSIPYELADKAMTAKLTTSEKKTILSLFEKRIYERVPVPYLTGVANFCGLRFKVTPDVLIPRSPIAELIENQFEPWINPDKVTHILDMCTGSGCIAIACSYAFDTAIIDAVDISKEALVVASENVTEHELEESVQLIESDLFSEVSGVKYDIIVSNPPYVSSDEMATLPKEYEHEPVLALEAEDAGLKLVDKMLVDAKLYLKEGGILIVEVGNSMPTLIEKYPTVPFTWLSFERGGDGVFLLTKEELDQHF